MIPETVTLTGRRNVPFVEEYDFTDENGAAVALTGATFAMQIRLYGGATTALANLSTVINPAVEGIYLTDAANGKITVRINQSTLNAFPVASIKGAADVFAYDLIITWADGTKECLIEGQFVLEPGVTQ